MRRNRVRSVMYTTLPIVMRPGKVWGWVSGERRRDSPPVAMGRVYHACVDEWGS